MAMSSSELTFDEPKELLLFLVSSCSIIIAFFPWAINLKSPGSPEIALISFQIIFLAFVYKFNPCIVKFVYLGIFFSDKSGQIIFLSFFILSYASFTFLNFSSAVFLKSSPRWLTLSGWYFMAILL